MPGCLVAMIFWEQKNILTTNRLFDVSFKKNSKKMRHTLLPLFLLVLIGCKSDDNLKPQNPSSCNDSRYTRGRTLNDQDAIVVKNTALGPNVFYLNVSDVAGFSAPVSVCNLPEQFKKDKLAVRISGYFLTYTGTGQEVQLLMPIELTRIEKR